MYLKLFNKLAAVTSIGGASLLCYQRKNELGLRTVFNSTTNGTTKAFWDDNWDHRACTSIVKPLAKDFTPEKENKYNEELEKHRSKAIRHIILVRSFTILKYNKIT